MVVFVRKDLNPKSQIVVQAAHSSIVAATKFKVNNLLTHPSLVVIEIENEIELRKTKALLEEMCIKFAEFYESDLNNEMTSITTEPLTKDGKKVFRKMKILRLD